MVRRERIWGERGGGLLGCWGISIEHDRDGLQAHAVEMEQGPSLSISKALAETKAHGDASGIFLQW